MWIVWIGVIGEAGELGSCVLILWIVWIKALPRRWRAVAVRQRVEMCVVARVERSANVGR
ncbi:MAG: hypothetical protein R8K47_02160 [Mariprofundaceae bacterium]